MKLQRDKLKQYQKNVCTWFTPPPSLLGFTPTLSGRQIQRVLIREHEIAKQHLANGHKDRALIALRQRKYQETLLAKTDAQLEQLEQLVRSLPKSVTK